MASRDPDAIRAAGTILSNSFNDLAVQVGDETVDGMASMQAWRLLACEYGMDCGPGDRQLVSACAFAGHCDATTVADLVYFYEISPSHAQQVDRYMQVFRDAIESENWSQVQFLRGPVAGPGRYMFSPPR